MSLWHCVELCKLSLPLILKCLGMLPLITYKHSNSLPAPCPCFHKLWLAYHLSNSETLLEMTLLTKVIARQTTRGLACLAAHLEVTLTHDWDWGIYETELKDYRGSSSGLQPMALDGPPDFWQWARSWEQLPSPIPEDKGWSGSSWALLCIQLHLYS